MLDTKWFQLINEKCVERLSWYKSVCLKRAKISVSKQTERRRVSNQPRFDEIFRLIRFVQQLRSFTVVEFHLHTSCDRLILRVVFGISSSGSLPRQANNAYSFVVPVAEVPYVLNMRSLHARDWLDTVVRSSVTVCSRFAPVQTAYSMLTPNAESHWGSLLNITIVIISYSTLTMGK